MTHWVDRLNAALGDFIACVPPAVYLRLRELGEQDSNGAGEQATGHGGREAISGRSPASGEDVNHRCPEDDRAKYFDLTCLACIVESDREMQERARLDADRTAKPKTEIVGVFRNPDDRVRTLHDGMVDEYLVRPTGDAICPNGRGTLRALLESSWRAVKGTRVKWNRCSAAGALLESGGTPKLGIALAREAIDLLERADRGECLDEEVDIEPPRMAVEVADVAE